MYASNVWSYIGGLQDEMGIKKINNAYGRAQRNSATLEPAGDNATF